MHKYGLYSAGPNEEWCIDGHEKILNTMGIAVYGIVDKFSRMEMVLRAVKNARLSDVPPIIYLELLKEKKGMPCSILVSSSLTIIVLINYSLPTSGMPVLTTSDMGTEVSKLIPLVTAIRYVFIMCCFSNPFIYVSLLYRNLAQPFLSTDDLPAFRTTKSIFNITRERAWRPIFEKDLSNVLYFYNAGKLRIGFQADDPLHEYVPSFFAY